MHQYIKRILILSVAISLLPTLLNALNIPFPVLEWLALSSFGLKSWKLYQPFTAPLLFSFDLRLDALALLSPLFMIFVARLANFLLDVDGPKSLLRFYIGSTIFTTLALLGFSLATGQDFVYFGPQPLFYAMIAYTIFIVPELELLLIIFPLRAKTFLLIGLGLSLLFCLDAGNYISFIATFSGALFGYFYALKKLRRHSPYTMLLRVEKGIFQLFDFFKPKPKCVIVDFKTGRPVHK